MNYAAKILNYLAGQDGFSQVLLVAGAPPIDKRNHDLRVVLDAILTPDDIRETLTTFAAHARRPGGPELGRQGVFAFGLTNLGRFRVHHLTQRGSDIVTIQKMPFTVPELTAILAQPAVLEELDALYAGREGGIVLVTGPSAFGNVQFVHALLKRINDTAARVLFIVEQNLSFLLRHKNSVVIQIEVGTDIGSLEEGIRNGLFLAPDVLYVRDVRTPAELVALMSAAEAGSLVFASVVALDEKFVLEDLRARLEDQYDNFCRLFKGIIRVGPTPRGTLDLRFTNVTVDGTGRIVLQPQSKRSPP